MHPRLRHQGTAAFAQVERRTSEQGKAAECACERRWFPPCSQPYALLRLPSATVRSESQQVISAVANLAQATAPDATSPVSTYSGAQQTAPANGMP